MRGDINIECIWIEIHEKLFGYISKHVKDKEDVNDIIQDTFVKVKTQIDTLKNTTKVENWIFRIAKNTMNDYFRKQKKSFKVEENVKKNQLDSNSFDDEDINIKIQTKEFSEYAGFIINDLPEKYKQAVYLSDIEGLSMKEIAQEMNISVSAAKSRVQRARKMIKEIILKCCDVNTDRYGNIIDYERNKCNPENKC